MQQLPPTNLIFHLLPSSPCSQERAQAAEYAAMAKMADMVKKVRMICCAVSPDGVHYCYPMQWQSNAHTCIGKDGGLGQ